MRISTKCDRCGKDDFFTPMDETELKMLQAREGKAEIIETKIEAFFSELPLDERPDVVMFVRDGEGFKLVVENHLCRAETGKRSCYRRVREFLDAMKLDPRAPKAPKDAEPPAK